VLLSAWHGQTNEGESALAIIEESSRQLLTSEMIRLELLPKPLFFGQKEEVEFYEQIFLRCRCDKMDASLYSKAFVLARRSGLAAADALNIASAIRLNADEFVTLEKPSKPMFRVRGIRVVTLYAAASD
jgi:predicted nucleic acid-binding protein